MNAVFLSDIHLRDSDSVKSKLVIRFLQEVASKFDRVFILGDLFDVWPGTNAHLVRTFRPVLQALKQLVENGHAIDYLEGNHDFRLGRYFSDSIGVRVHADAMEETWNGKRIYMAHGDLGNPRDLSYRALRYLLRHDLLHFALRAVPQDFLFQVGIKSSKLSRKYQTKISAGEKTDAAIRQIYRASAKAKFAQGYDVVLMGHTHLPDDFHAEVHGRSCRYINTGDWVRHFTYLEFDGVDFYTRSHPVKNL